MKNILGILIFIIFTVHLNAQILECRSYKNEKISVQISKYKFEELRTSGGITYKKVDYSEKYNITTFKAITKNGTERISINNASQFKEGIEFFKLLYFIELKNKEQQMTEMFCYDLNQMNKKRNAEGITPSPIIVKDY